jgi:hypothetical protein
LSGLSKKEVNMKVVKLIVLGVAGAAFCVWMAGCTTSKDARTASAERISASHDASINNALEQQVIPNITVSGSSNSVVVAPQPLKRTTDINDAVDTEGAANNMSRSSFRFSMSTWLAFGFALFGLAFALVGWVVFSRGSAAGKAADATAAEAINAAHTGFASVMSTVETLLAHSKDDATTAQLLTIKSAVEKERGKL